VIACGRNDLALRQLHTEHPAIEGVQCDITVWPNVLTLVETIRDRCGVVDVLVNNAGIMERVDLLEESVSDERIAHEIAVNLTGPILLTRRPAPAYFSKPDDCHGHVGIRVAARHARSNLLRDQGRSPLLHDGTAAAGARRWHPRCRSTATIG
jgi:NAD(P)-dependent dehydrogenase (short-subunit alcohol dehydrogenase family)